MMSSGTQTLSSLCASSSIHGFLPKSQLVVAAHSPRSRHSDNQRTSEISLFPGSLGETEAFPWAAQQRPLPPPLPPSCLISWNCVMCPFLETNNGKRKKPFCCPIRASLDLGAGSSSTDYHAPSGSIPTGSFLSAGSGVKVMDFRVSFRRPDFRPGTIAS